MNPAEITYKKRSTYLISPCTELVVGLRAIYSEVLDFTGDRTISMNIPINTRFQVSIVYFKHLDNDRESFLLSS